MPNAIIRPKHLHDADRFEELVNAELKCIRDNEKIPDAWLSETCDLLYDYVMEKLDKPNIWGGHDSV